MGQSKVRLARHHHNAVLRQNIVAELYKQGYNYREIREEVMIGGALVPIDKDLEGNLIYKFNGARF